MQKKTEIETTEEIRSDYLFSSDFYEIKNWAFDLKKEDKTAAGYNDCFCIVFIRKGNFLLNLSDQTYDMHTGHIVIEKPCYEYRMRPAAGECSIFNFSNAFYQQAIEDYKPAQSFFFTNSNILSVVLNSSPEIDYLQHQIMSKVAKGGKLEMDNLVLLLLEQLFDELSGHIPNITASTWKSNFCMVEHAKEYINENFSEDISLQELAAHCNISPFHFCRTFKKITGCSPYQYLLYVRLKHAKILLHTTALPITDISYASGFSNAAHFATLFRQKYILNPSQYRNKTP